MSELLYEPLSAHPLWDDPPDNEHTELALEIIKGCPHTQGPAAAQGLTLGDTWLDWQDRACRILFGLVDDRGYRIITEAYWEMPKKTGKSTTASAIGLTCGTVDQEEGGQIYSGGFNQDQAKVTWQLAVDTIRRDELLEDPLGLEDEVLIREYRNEIIFSETGGVWKPLTRGETGKHGFNPSLVIFDELHEQPNGEMIAACRESMGARTQPLLLALTNAGVDRQSVCYRQRHYARQVNDGTIEDPNFFGLIFGVEQPEGDEDPGWWTREETWKRAHPGLGTTVSLDWMRARCRKAQQIPTEQNDFLRWQLGIWTQQTTKWLDPLRWAKCEAGTKTSGVEAIDWEDYEGGPCYGGLDLGAVDDLSAWALAFPDKDDPELLRIKLRVWCPEYRLVADDNPYRDLYRAWADKGLLELHPGRVTDYKAIERQIIEDAELYGLVDFNMDVAFQGLQMAIELIEDAGLEMATIGGGYRSMSGPCKELERRYLLDPPKVVHDGNEILAWAVSNVMLKHRPMDPEHGCAPTKEVEEAKIDPVLALLFALERAMRHEDKRSIYEEQDLLVIG